MITPSYSITATERVLPKLALDFTTASLDPRVTFTRTGNTATVTNSSGSVVGVNADLPRFDYDPVTLVCKGLLIEEARTNLATNSSDFTTWTAYQASVSSDPLITTTAPNTAEQAQKLIENTVTDQHRLAKNFTVVDSTVYTYSVYAKASGRTRFRIRLGTSGAAGTFLGSADFELSTGVVAASSGVTTPSITNVGNGWYRCTVTDTSSGTVSGVALIMMVGGAVSYEGDNTSGMFFWGFQLEAGAFPTSYIPTTTTALTRNTDVATMTGTNFSDWFNASAGTLQASGVSVVPTNVGSVRLVASIYDTTALNNALRLEKLSADARCIKTISGSSSVYGLVQWVFNSRMSLAIAYSSNAGRASVNGAAGANLTSGAPTGLATLGIGGAGASNILNGWVQKINYWPQQLTSNEVQAFSK